MPLTHWLSRSYFRAAIIPLLLIEFSFLAIYWLSGNFIYERNVEAIRGISRDYLSDIANREAATTQATLGSVEGLARLFALESGHALSTPYAPPPEEKARYALSPSGVFHTRRGTPDQTASFYSGIVPVGPQQIDKVWRTAQLDRTMRAIRASSPLVRQVYLNTWDSYNRIYPYFDALKQYAPGMNIPAYNFYYEADARHNPQRKVVWTDAYIDPAGGGWMVSATAPVYRGDHLEAVVGIDLTVDTILKHILDINLPWHGYAVLIGRDGTILALPPAGERDFGLKELKDYHYNDAIRADTFKPEHFNINRRPELKELATAIASGKPAVTGLTLSGKAMLASSAPVAGPNWSLVVLAPAQSILADSDALRDRLRKVGMAMLGILVLFYAGFFLFLTMRARQMSQRVSEPLRRIEGLMERIGGGDYDHQAPQFGVTELDTLADRLVTMGGRLGAAHRQIVEQEVEVRRALDTERRITGGQRRFINILSHEFRTPLTIIDSSAQILRRRAGRLSEETLLERSDMIRHAASRVEGVMTSALQLVALEEGQISHKPEPVDLGRLVREAVRAGGQARASIPVTMGDLPEGVLLRVDPALIHSALTALIENACKYSREDGTVSIAAQIIGKACRITVSDTGIGIAPEDLPRVRDRFYRGANSTAVPGAGTGLYLASTLVEAHNGQLDLASTLDVGTQASITLPLADLSLAPESEAA